MRLKWFKNLNPHLQLLILSGLIFVLLIIYLPLAKYIKPATVSCLSSPLKFSEGISSNARQFFSFNNLVEENRILRSTVDKLNAQLIQMKELSLENQRLRNILSLTREKAYKTTVAYVISKDSSNWTNVVLINKGTLHGIREGMPVIWQDSLVGKVIEVGLNVSKVSLLLDFDSKIPAKIVRSREEGIVFGTKEAGRNVCKMKYLQEVQLNDEVISSGLGEIFPSGLLIGRVVAVEEDENRLYKVAEVRPAVDLLRLEEATVITGQ